MTEIVASPCNMNCISSPLLARYSTTTTTTTTPTTTTAATTNSITCFHYHRLAQLYSPLELEDIVDPKDKIKRYSTYYLDLM